MFLLNHKQKLQSEQSECFINQLEVCIMGGSTKKMGMHRRSEERVWGFGPIRWASRIHARARSHTTGAVLGISRIGRHIYGAVKSNGPLADDFALFSILGGIVISLGAIITYINIDFANFRRHFCV